MDLQGGPRYQTPSKEKGSSPMSLPTFPQATDVELSSQPGPGTQPPVFAAEFSEGHGRAQGHSAIAGPW